MIKQRSFFLIVGVIVLLLTGIGGFWLVRESSLSLRGGSQSTPAAAMFVPKQAPVMVSMLVNPNRIESLGQVVSGSERRKLRTQLQQLKTSLFANTGLDYQRDVQPWIGDELTLAVTNTDIDRDAANGQQTGYLMAIATKNAAKSREFLDLLFSKRAVAGKDLTFEQYEGIKLISDQPRSISNQAAATQNLAGAVVGDSFVLFANHPKVIRDAINNVQATDLNLATSSQYQQALTLLPSRSIGLFFLNLPSVVAWQGLKPAAQTYESQIIALELNRKGLLAQTALLAAPNQNSSSAPTLSQPVEALKYIPDAISLAVSGSDLSHLENTDLNQLWQQTTASGAGEGLSRLINQPLAELQARWGIDLAKDIFSWVQGEYALGILPREGQTPDLIFVAQKSAAADQGISHLDEIAQQQGLSATPLPLENQKVSAWTQLTTVPSSSNTDTGITLRAKVQGVHTTVGNYEIFTTSVEAMDAALKAPKNGALIDSPKFKASIAPIPTPNAGYVYLDWAASHSMLERQLPILKLLEVAGKPFFNNLRSLTVSSYDQKALKASAFFQLSN
mgnify:CR=1 FL=1